MNVLAAATAAAAANATVSTTDCFLTSSSSFFAKIPRSCLYRPNSFLSIFHPILVAKDAAWLTTSDLDDKAVARRDKEIIFSYFQHEDDEGNSVTTGDDLCFGHVSRSMLNFYQKNGIWRRKTLSKIYFFGCRQILERVIVCFFCFFI